MISLWEGIYYILMFTSMKVKFAKNSTKMTLGNIYTILRLQISNYLPMLESQSKTLKNNWIPLHFCGKRWGYSGVYIQIMSCARDNMSYARVIYRAHEIISRKHEIKCLAHEILSFAWHNFFQKKILRVLTLIF